MTRRDEILQVICDYADAHVGNSPSQRDLLRALEKCGYALSKGTLQTHLLKLQAEGRLQRKDGKLIVTGADWIPPEQV